MLWIDCMPPQYNQRVSLQIRECSSSLWHTHRLQMSVTTSRPVAGNGFIQHLQLLCKFPTLHQCKTYCTFPLVWMISITHHQITIKTVASCKLMVTTGKCSRSWCFRDFSGKLWFSDLGIICHIYQNHKLSPNPKDQPWEANGCADLLRRFWYYQRCSGDF